MGHPDLETVQRFVDGPWRHAARARDACERNAWQAFQQEQQPRPGLHRPLLRRSYKRCITRCVELFQGPRDATFTVVPIWVGNAFEEDSDSWLVAHALQVADGPFGIHETCPMLEDARLRFDSVLRGRAKVWDVGNIVHTSSYAPSVPLEIRDAHFGVLRGDVVVVTDVQAEQSSSLPRPTIVVPAFCSWIEPRVAGLDGVTSEAIGVLAITVDDEGNLISRQDAKR